MTHEELNRRLGIARLRMLEEMDKQLPNMMVISAMANAAREIREMMRERGR